MLFGNLLLWMSYAGAGVALVIAAVIDARTHRLPNKIILPLYPALIALLCLSTVLTGRWVAFWTSLASGALLWLFYYLLGMLKAGSIGFGDVKLAGVVGLLLGYLSWTTTIYGTLLCYLAAALYGLVLLAMRKATMRTAIPFGPFMVGGAALAVGLQLAFNA